MKQILCFLIIISFISGCGKIIPDLKRDNPNDTAYVGNDANKVRILKYFNSSVTCKYSQGATNYSEENTIKKGDRIFLNVILKNTSNFLIENIRATFSCSSSFIQLVQPSSGYYVKFSESSSNIDYISSGKTGFGEITNGQYYHFAPNYNSYAIEFFVLSSANSGNTFIIKINLSDNLNNNWVENINLTVQ